MEYFNDLADFSVLEIKELLTLACKLDEKPETIELVTESIKTV